MQSRGKQSPWSDCSANPKQTGKQKHLKLDSDSKEILGRFKPKIEISKEIVNK